MSRESILICHDGSESAEHSFNAAAGVLAGRKAILADIGPVLTEIESYAAVTPGFDIAFAEQANLAAALERAERGAELARKAGFDAEARAELSAPTWKGIVDLADEVNAAVIVIGSRGLRGVRERLKRSVSHQVAEHSRRPVLIVTPHHKRRYGPPPPRR
jgi:nucleotide-binding universal stress UspA family protein